MSVFLLAMLCLPSCATKPEAQSRQPVEVAEITAPQSSMKATLLAVIQKDLSLGTRPFCPLTVVGKQGITISRIDYEGSEKYQAWVEKEYFTRKEISKSAFTLVPTQRYLDVLSHATNPVSPTPRVCLGTSQITALANLRQINPTKFMAGATLTPTLAPWVTPEIMKLFGPARNHPIYVPLDVVFLRNGNTWTVERL
ncbi:hypothetical protein ACI3L1_18610 [Deinococcus sp. SM5_A1]|uniref:hypothetical protein n=1 Tax=Deinococcus sp. SM5_A1 TaxID=3379094 RepID=UPI00385F72B2